MVVERTSPTSSSVEVFDRVLDKGIVIDAWVRVALMGIDLITVRALVVVASIQTYLESSEALARAGFASPVEARTNAMTSTNAHPRQWQNALKKRQYRPTTPPGGDGKSRTLAAGPWWTVADDAYTFPRRGAHGG